VDVDVKQAGEQDAAGAVDDLAIAAFDFAATPMILSPSTSTSAVWSFGESSLAIWAWR
jgi:hypothetical protein